jgi:hypothetical protein
MVVSSPFLLGILFNILIICVLCKNPLVKPNARFLLQMIATADIVLLVMATIPAFVQIMMVSLGDNETAKHNHFLWSLLTFNVMVALPVMHTASTTSLWLLMFLAIDSALKIYRPLTAEKYMSCCGFCGVTLALWFCSAVLNLLPNMLVRPYGLIVSANAIVPIVVLLFIVCHLVRFLRSGCRGDQTNNDAIDDNERDWIKAVIVMGLATVAVQIASHLCEIYLVLNLHDVHDINLATGSKIALADAITWISIALNSSIKFVIYLTVVSASFRHRLWSCCCCCCCCIRRDHIPSPPVVQLTDVAVGATDKLLSDTTDG